MPRQLKTCRRVTKDDEFYTRYEDVVRELHKYDLRERKIICPCDTKKSNIYRYLKHCQYNVTCSSTDWRKINYNDYDLVITNPPFSQIREFVQHLEHNKIDFIIVISDVMRYMIQTHRYSPPCLLYLGRDIQKFARPDGTLKHVHCRWVATLPDNYRQNTLINKSEE